MKFDAFGKTISIESAKKDTLDDFGERELIRQSVEVLDDYSRSSDSYRQKMIANEQWYKARHWDEIRNEKFSDEPEPVAAFLTNTIMNKHAEAMDFYPVSNILPREMDDQQEAEFLSDILPVEMEYAEFKKTWSKGWWEKLKHGCAVYAVLYDPEGQKGIGSGAVALIDGLNFYHQGGINTLQESGSIFVVQPVYKEKVAMEYPELDMTRANKIFEPKQYLSDDNYDISKMTVIVDRYYKAKNSEGKTILHYLKFVGDQIIFSTELDPKYQETGWYNHGQYPFVIDVLFPEKDNIRGFGIIDLLKSPQIYIDKLDQIISRNAFTTGRKRYLVNRASSINEEELTNIENDVVHFDGTLQDDLFREISQNPIPNYIPEHRQIKIDEMKDVSGSNDYSRGQTTAGVTAASAIIALQQANSKISRDMIGESYSNFTEIVYLYIEVIRQFYDIERAYRIGEGKNQKFVQYSNARIKDQLISGVMGQEMYRKPIFDIRVVPEKQDPFSRAAHNEMAKELFQMGVFDPNRYLESRVMLKMMQFDGKNVIEEELEKNTQIMQALALIPMLKDENMKLRAIVQELTGKDMQVDLNAMREAYNNGQGQDAGAGQPMGGQGQGTRQNGGM